MRTLLIALIPAAIAGALVYTILLATRANLPREAKATVSLGIGFVVLVLALLFDGILALFYSRFVERSLIDALNASPYLASAAGGFTSTVVMLVWWYGIKKGWPVQLLLVVLFSFLPAVYASLMFVLTDKNVATASGLKTKCVSLGSQGQVTYLNYTEGEPLPFDPKTARQCIPLTPDLKEALDVVAVGGVILSVDPRQRPWFGVNGQPLLWYSKSPTGEYEFFDVKLPVSPYTGARLTEVTTLSHGQWQSDRHAMEQAGKVARDEAARQRARDQFARDLELQYQSSTLPLVPQAVILRATGGNAAVEVVDGLRVGLAHPVLDAQSTATRNIANSISTGNFERLAAAGVFERVSRLVLVDVSASCRDTQAIAGAVVCDGSAAVTMFERGAKQASKHTASISSTSTSRDASLRDFASKVSIP